MTNPSPAATPAARTPTPTARPAGAGEGGSLLLVPVATTPPLVAAGLLGLLGLALAGDHDLFGPPGA